jgi:pimeloyl-ACP methyl ester carboxylesterase
MMTWVLLRGLTRESRHWGGFVDGLDHALPGQQLVPLDLPGNGLLNRHVSPSRVSEMVESCRAQLAQRQIQPPYHVLAMSLGAMVAVAWSQSYPQEVAAQVLINTSMRPFNPFYQRLLPANYAVLLKLILFGADPQQWERAVLRLTSTRSDTSVLPLWLALRRANPVSNRNALRQLLAAARFCASPGSVLTPTLLLASEQDQLVSVECARSMARHWHCPLRLHPTAGHDLPLDDGQWVASQVCDWVLALG